MLVAQFGATGFLWILDVLDFVLCRLAAEVDGFVIEIVNSANVANGLTTGAHQYGMRDRCPSDQFDSWQQGAVGDASSAKDSAITGNNALRMEHALQILSREYATF